MRLGIDASNLRSGGGITHLEELLRAAVPTEHGIEKIVVWGGKTTLARLSAPNPSVKLVHERLLDWALPVRIYWQLVRLPQLAKSFCDVLFVPGGSYRGSFQPYVTMSRNMLPFEPQEGRRYGLSWVYVKLRLLRVGQMASFRKADGIIFLTEYARTVVTNRAKTLNGADIVIPHGVSENFYAVPRPQKDINEYSHARPFKLLYVSIVDLYKHQWRVAEAVATLRSAGLPLELQLVGQAYGPALRRLRRVIRRVDPEGIFVKYSGAVEYGKLPSVYHQADLFVFASSCENMPNILLEAMASGLPIACSRKGPMPELLSDAGVYFDPDDSESIAEAIRLLVCDRSLRERCAGRAYETARKYSWKRCARETLEFIVRVYKRGSSPKRGVTAKTDGRKSDRNSRM